MASPMTSISRPEVTALVRQVQGNQLFNRQLSSVCQVNGLKSTGVKAELQRRIVDLINETVTLNDVSRFHQVRQSIVNAVAQRSSPAKAVSVRSGAIQHLPALPGSLQPTMAPFGAANFLVPQDCLTGIPGQTNGHRQGLAYSTLLFKQSPFYQIEIPVSDVRTCEVMQQHRTSVAIPLKLQDHPGLQKCLDDSTFRVMIFCAGENSGVQEVAFPHQSELRVNGGDIKANLRGLKNKPGSTRPVDITSALRLRPNYVNNIDFTYALTTKKFYLIINLCKITPVAEMVSTVSRRRRIPKESVVAELNKKAQDPDVVATSQVLSLKCPLSYMRLDVPCRSLSCTHIQCFDATSYLELQLQGPQWLCPICNKSAPYEQLAIDEYVKDILESTPKSLEAVTIEPDGLWSTKPPQGESSTRSSGAQFGDDDEDDELEISEINIVAGRRVETPKRPTPTIVSASSGRDVTSGVLRGTASTSAKRPAPAVIDLTFSSDDEDEPRERPSKRQHTSSNGYHGSSNLGFLSDSPADFPP